MSARIDLLSAIDIILSLLILFILLFYLQSSRAWRFPLNTLALIVNRDPLLSRLFGIALCGQEKAFVVVGHLISAADWEVHQFAGCGAVYDDIIFILLNLQSRCWRRLVIGSILFSAFTFMADFQFGVSFIFAFLLFQQAFIVVRLPV